MHTSFDPAPHHSFTPSLVGRDSEMALLRQCYERAQAGDGQLVLVYGEAGIGKTALVRELTEEIGQRGALTLVGHCYDLSTTPPYEVWLEMTDRFPSRLPLPEVPRVLKRGTGVGDLDNQMELFAVAHEFLVQVSAQLPLILVLEDLHWADQASLDLLRYLARQIAGKHRVLIIATYRDDEIPRQHPLYTLIPILVRENQATRIKIGSLGSDDVRQLVSGRWTLRSDDQARLVDHLLVHAEGNPLFTVEVLRTLEQGGFLAQVDGGWFLHDLDEVPVPSLVHQVIEGRVARLRQPTRQLLRIAAVIGQEVPIDLWQRVGDIGEIELIDVLEQSVEAQLLQEGRDGRCVYFSHALIREALYESTLVSRRMTLHRRIADDLIKSTRPDPDMVAHHLQQAGDARVVEWLVKSGERAQRNYAWLVASERFEMAQKALQGDQSRALERAWLLYRIGRLWRFADVSRAIKLLSEAVDIAEAVGDPVLRAYAHFDFGHLRIFAGDLRHGLDQMVAAAPALDKLDPGHTSKGSPIARWVADSLPPEEYDVNDATDTEQTCHSVNMRLGLLVMWLAIAGRTAEALDIGHDYIATASEIEHPGNTLLASIGDAYYGLGVALALSGRVPEARRAFVGARKSHEAIRHHRMVTADLWQELVSVQFPYYTDAVSERRQLVHDAETAWQASIHLGDWSSADTDLLAARTSLLRLEGRWAEASQQGPTLLGALAREQGEAEKAWTTVRNLLPDGPSSQPGDTTFTTAIESQRLAAALSLDAGDFPAAREWLEAHDRWLSWADAVLGQAEGALLWAEYYRAQGDTQTSRQHADRALLLASDPRQPLVLIAVHRFLGDLDTESGHLTDASYHLQQSLALANACGAPFERALTLLEEAKLMTSRGDERAAFSLLTEVHRLCLKLGARPTLDKANQLMRKLRPRRLDGRFGLTGREVDVLRLIVEGKTDREIAADLFISHHTVMRHVSHILDKLDVESRTAAAAWAVRQGIV